MHIDSKIQCVDYVSDELKLRKGVLYCSCRESTTIYSSCLRSSRSGSCLEATAISESVAIDYRSFDMYLHSIDGACSLNRRARLHRQVSPCELRTCHVLNVVTVNVQ